VTFVALAGAMIGATFTPDLMALLPHVWITALAVLAFIPSAHALSFVVMRHVGGFSRRDAFFAAMPGGLVEASILGEKAGADPKALAIQHFIRVLLVVLLVPLLFLIVTGQTVGSAAGQGLSTTPADVRDVGWLLVIAPAGIALGRLLRLPAAHLMGPLMVAGALQSTSITDLAVPIWLLNTAQLVIGVGLGGQISGLTGGELWRGFRAGVASVAAMLCLTLSFALVFVSVAPTSLSVLFLSFAPGGVPEMSLIALSLDTSPIWVALHHMIRIVVTVLLTGALAPRLDPWFATPDD